MESDESNLATEEQLNEVCAYISSNPLVTRTPSLHHAQTFLRGHGDRLQNVDVTLKMEHLQNTGSFKIRGLVNQTRFLPKDVLTKERSVVTMSAGNYGKAYGHILKDLGLSGVCLMPLTAPVSRINTVQGYGVKVDVVPTNDMISTVNQYINQLGCHFMHSYDDINLITAYASIGDEILIDEPQTDIVVVGCGGGALLSGIACRVKSKRPQCRVYGIEPENASTMYESFKQNKAVTSGVSKSIAGGLAPPSAGVLPFRHCKKYVDDIILVTEEEIKNAVRVLFESRMIVEPAGCASLAALIEGKIPNVDGKKVTIVLSGGNITFDELHNFLT